MFGFPGDHHNHTHMDDVLGGINALAVSRETPESDNDATCAELKVNVGGVGQSGKKYVQNS